MGRFSRQQTDNIFFLFFPKKKYDLNFMQIVS